jgi:hypothetical protein
MPEGSTPAGIDGDAPVLARHEILMQAPIDAIWQLHIAVNEWPTWQTDINAAHLDGDFVAGASFDWTVSGFSVTSTIYDVSPPTGDVSPQARTLWGGTGQGITGIHEWSFSDMTQGVLVSTNESQAGAPVEADPAVMQSLLNKSLVAWLGHLKAAAESRV